MKLISLVFLFSIILSGCKEYGTEGGNPENNQGAIGQTTSLLLTDLICEKRSQCTGILDATCSNQFLRHPQVTNELKMNPPYTTLIELSDAEFDKKILVSTDNFKACTAVISALNCQDSLAIEAFNPATYSQIHKSLRASVQCSDIFYLIK